jgi:hypothetical protein
LRPCILATEHFPIAEGPKGEKHRNHKGQLLPRALNLHSFHNRCICNIPWGGQACGTLQIVGEFEAWPRLHQRISTDLRPGYLHRDGGFVFVLMVMAVPGPVLVPLQRCEGVQVLTPSSVR